jgi:hypothetical protein
MGTSTGDGPFTGGRSSSRSEVSVGHGGLIAGSGSVQKADPVERNSVLGSRHRLFSRTTLRSGEYRPVAELTHCVVPEPILIRLKASHHGVATLSCV